MIFDGFCGDCLALEIFRNIYRFTFLAFDWEYEMFILNILTFFICHAIFEVIKLTITMLLLNVYIRFVRMIINIIIVTRKFEIIK